MIEAAIVDGRRPGGADELGANPTMDTIDNYDPTSDPELPPRPARSRAPRVLLIDDDQDFLEATAAALALEGLMVTVAKTPGEGLMRAVRDPPDVILLDIMLHGVDGIDVLEALRAEPETRAIPILACTALGTRDSARLLPTLGFDGLLAKPLDARELARALRSHARARSEE